MIVHCIPFNVLVRVDSRYHMSYESEGARQCSLELPLILVTAARRLRSLATREACRREMLLRWCQLGAVHRTQNNKIVGFCVACRLFKPQACLLVIVRALETLGLTAWFDN